MKTKDIVEHMLSGIKDRKECLHLAFDRGRKEGKQIENWILTEMNAKLIELNKNIHPVEGEHKYEDKKENSTRYEHCDLWWCINNQEHWLEVKTIVFCEDKRRGNLNQISIDLKKLNQVSKSYIRHHMTMAFIELSVKETDWRKQIVHIYENTRMKEEATWDYNMKGGNLSILLYTC